MPTTLTIPARFNGPPDSGNGGYGCGAVASLLDTPAVVELRAPIPLDTPLEVSGTDDGVEVHHRDALVARARPAPAVELTPPSTVGLASASEAVDDYAGFVDHAFPTCFVCGPDRPAGDGLRIFPGPVPGAGVVAAPWTPDPSLATDDGRVRPELVWAALDCPSGFAVFDGRVAVLARMQVRRYADVPVGEPVVVLAWRRGEEGRKLGAASAVQHPDGRVLAVADALWIELRAP